MNILGCNAIDDRERGGRNINEGRKYAEHKESFYFTAQISRILVN